MKLARSIKIIIVLIGLVAIAVFVCKNISQNKIEAYPDNFQENTGQELFLVIDGGDGSPESLKADFSDGITAFDLLKNETENLGIILETKAYDMGIFIEKIGDKKNGEGEKYWLYYVNGEMPQVAADKERLKAGDRVEFKFEKSSF